MGTLMASWSRPPRKHAGVKQGNNRHELREQSAVAVCWLVGMSKVLLDSYSTLASGSPDAADVGAGTGVPLICQIPQARTNPVSPLAADRSPAQPEVSCSCCWSSCRRCCCRRRAVGDDDDVVASRFIRRMGNDDVLETGVTNL